MGKMLFLAGLAITGTLAAIVGIGALCMLRRGGKVGAAKKKRRQKDKHKHTRVAKDDDELGGADEDEDEDDEDDDDADILGDEDFEANDQVNDEEMAGAAPEEVDEAVMPDEGAAQPIMLLGMSEAAVEPTPAPDEVDFDVSNPPPRTATTDIDWDLPPAKKLVPSVLDD